MHAPSQARRLAAEARAGRVAPEQLLADARALADPYHAAWALFQVSSQARMVLPAAHKAMREAFRLAAAVPEPWRRAELAAELAGKIPSWRPGDDSHAAREARAAVADDLLALAAGLPADRQAPVVEAVAAAVPAAALPRLLDVALAGGGLEGAKAVLQAWMSGPGSTAIGPALHSRIRSLGDQALAARLFGHLHGQAARAGLHPGFDAWAEATGAVARSPAAARAEALRYLATVAPGVAELEALRGAAEGLGDESRARVLSTLAGRADKLGDPPRAAAWFDEGLAAAAGIAEPKARAKVEENLRAGVARLAGAPPQPAAAAAPAAGRAPGAAAAQPTGPPAGHAPAPPAAAPGPPGPPGRPVLALHNGYDGGLKPVHTQAVARAAPLCLAFGLDLALVGFPADDAAQLVAAVEAESRIAQEGEGPGPTGRLLAQGRLRLVPRDRHARPFEWGLGTVVATTQSPDPAKPTDLAALLAAGPVCIAMGLGHRGLPPQLLRAAPHHLELTGSGVPLETATVMGVIAERMGALLRDRAP